MNDRIEYVKDIRENNKKFKNDIEGDCDLVVSSIVSDLKEKRIEKGLSQQDIADATGMRAPNITRIETMKTRPSLEVLMRYAAALGYEVDIKLTKRK